jgi:thiol peroxidase
MRLTLIPSALLFLAACATTNTAPTIPVNKETVQPGTSVKRGGTPMKLAQGKLDLNKPMPAVALTDSNWDSYTFKGDGKVRIVSFVPSVDTRVCEEQTHVLGETAGINPKVERVTISRDLPAAQKRFAEESNLKNITYLSDFKTGGFGKAAGLLIEENGLLARGVAVVDGQGNVVYLQIVPELGNLPDMAKAIEVANGLVK